MDSKRFRDRSPSRARSFGTHGLEWEGVTDPVVVLLRWKLRRRVDQDITNVYLKMGHVLLKVVQ